MWNADNARNASPAIQRNIAGVLTFIRQQTGPETLLADVHGRHGHGMASAYNLADRGTPGTADRAARRGLGTQPRTLGQLGRRVLAG